MRISATLLLAFLFANAYAQSPAKLYMLAKRSLEKGDHVQAVQQIDQAINQDQSQLDYFLLRIEALTALEEYQQVLVTYTGSLQFFPEAIELYVGRGILLLEFGENQYAITDFSNALDLAITKTDSLLVLNNRAAAKQGLRDFEGAYQDLVAAYQLDSTDAGVLINLGAVSDEVGRGDETLMYLLRALEVDPGSVAAMGNIGFKYQEEGAYQEAIRYFEMILEQSPEEPLAFSNLSYCQYKLGKLEEAMESIQQSILYYAENAYAYRTRALIYLAQDETENACADLELAITKGFTQQYGAEVTDLQKVHCE
ncbi:MAG TPA: hypothetical protein DCR93_02160 [Cytophagales bacterium]|nr:hypothetical protein [Cytophagales bacterium]HAP58355.1 hypothetical protein [Cytophagales bacterium]